MKNFLNPARTMTLTYVVSLTVIAVLSMFVHVTLDKIITEQSQSAYLINVSGQQRMLSQRIALYTFEFISKETQSAKNKAQAALDKLLENHQYLLKEHWSNIDKGQPSHFSDAMQRLYFFAPHHVDKKVTEYANLINQALDTSRPISITQTTLPELTFLPLAKDKILDSLNAVVSQYELESAQKIRELRGTQKLVLIIIILTIFVEAVFIIGPLLVQSDRFSRNLEEDANHDYLTNLLNRRSFNLLATQSVAMSKRYQSSLSVISFDIDHFKSINDQYGHDVGDHVIRQVANTIQANSRESDSVFRFGGEEFLILLPNTSIIEAKTLADKIIKKIADSPVFCEKLILEITASAGVAEWEKNESDLNGALKRADKILYQAKESGRNRVL